jgi:membrane protease YdiL (CAAX protease family)
MSEIGEVTDMDSSNGKPQPRNSAALRLWTRVPVVIRAVLVGFLVFAIAGAILWTSIIMLVPAPWSIVLMAVVLWIYLKYFSGSWWPKSTAEARRLCFRDPRMSSSVWKWSLLSALFAVVALESSLMVTFRIFEFPAEDWALAYNLGAVPAWLAWLLIVMASLVAGITEEVGFRGYMQVPLEGRYGPSAGISIVALMFVVVHLNQAWVSPPILVLLFGAGVLWGILAYSAGSLIPAIISHVLADIFNFSYWWSDVAGSFDRHPIAETGVDSHFVVWLLVFVAGLALFFWAARITRLASVRSRVERASRSHQL